MKVAWVSSWNKICGIADYSKELWPEVKKALQIRGDCGELIAIDELSEDHLVDALIKIKPHIIHFQHEYGLYGGKNPPFYFFPRVVDRLRTLLPETKIIATAHTVLSDAYKFPVHGRGWQTPVRMALNFLFLKTLKTYWGPKTWGKLDSTIVHSTKQFPVVSSVGASSVSVIPHFVFSKDKVAERFQNEKNVVVFGFFTPEKGQDIAIKAFAKLKEYPQVKLILAGGVRRSEDQSYFEECLSLIEDLGLKSQVTVTGYLAPAEVQNVFSKADLVVAPFRATTGSGSLAQVLARGLPLLASDLELNKEIQEREPGSLELFKALDPESLSSQIAELIFDRARLKELRQGALRYATSLNPQRIAFEHLHIYDRIYEKGETT